MVDIYHNFFSLPHLSLPPSLSILKIDQRSAAVRCPANKDQENLEDDQPVIPLNMSNIPYNVILFLNAVGRVQVWNT